MLHRLRLSRFPGTQRYTLAAPGDWPSCNPSIAKDGDGFCVIVRTINYRLRESGLWIGHPPGGARTINWLMRLDRNLKTVSVSRIADQDLTASEPRAGNGVEDARLFYWRNAWWFIGSGAEFVIDDAHCTICICRLDAQDRIAETHFLASPFDRKKEKNWMPIVDGDRLKLVYRISPLQIIDVEDGGGSKFCSLEDNHIGIDGWAGSSQLVEYQGNWLCVVHKRIQKEKRLYYQHIFVELSRDLRILRVSPPWYFDEPTVEFCAGVCLADGNAILSYGHLDREARLLKLPLWVVEDLLANSWRSRFALWRASVFGRKN